MFFLAATLAGWIGGDFVYRKVAAKNIFNFLFFITAAHKHTNTKKLKYI